MKLNVLWLVILLVSTSVCLSVPDPFKHRMKRVGIAGFQLLSLLLGSISSLTIFLPTGRGAKRAFLLAISKLRSSSQ